MKPFRKGLPETLHHVHNKKKGGGGQRDATATNIAAYFCVGKKKK